MIHVRHTQVVTHLVGMLHPQTIGSWTTSLDTSVEYCMHSSSHSLDLTGHVVSRSLAKRFWHARRDDDVDKWWMTAKETLSQAVNVDVQNFNLDRPIHTPTLTNVPSNDTFCRHYLPMLAIFHTATVPHSLLAPRCGSKRTKCHGGIRGCISVTWWGKQWKMMIG